jgi:uncharacterized membrane protein YukC
MDSIDITDSAFSLDMPDMNNVIQFDSTTDFLRGTKLPFDNNIFIYIGILVLVSLIGFFVYNYYQNKKNKQNVSFEDCPGGFCTTNQLSNRII